MSLGNADFTRAIYVGGNFAGAQLRGASFRNARLVAANFEGADLRGAAFDGSECTACNFAGAALGGATFIGTQMVAANFHGLDAASIEDAQIRALLSGCIVCNFAMAKLGGRDLSKVSLIQIDFSDADLTNAKFDGAVLCRYNVNGMQRAMACDSLLGAHTAGATFQNVRICENPMTQTGCTTVDAATLQRLTQPTPSPSPTSSQR